MQLIIMSCLFSLVSILAYAADAPVAHVSYAAEKAEVAIHEVTLPEEISFTIPTEGGKEIHTLKLDKLDAIDLTSFEEIIQENAQQGLPTPMALATYLTTDQSVKVGHSAYTAKNLIKTFQAQLAQQKKMIEQGYQDELNPNLDPLTNCDVVRTSVYLVNVNDHTTPAAIQTIYLGNLDQKTLCMPPEDVSEDPTFKMLNLIKELKKTNDDKEIKTIQFFIESGKIYCAPHVLQKNYHSVYDLRLATTFFTKALTAMEKLPENIFYDHNALEINRKNCLRRCGNIFAGLYVSFKDTVEEKKFYARNALCFYDAAIKRGDNKAESKAFDFITNRIDITSFKESGYGPTYLRKAESRALELPTTMNRLRIIQIHEKLENNTEACRLRAQFFANYPTPAILRKNRSKPQQDEPASKRGKLN